MNRRRLSFFSIGLSLVALAAFALPAVTWAAPLASEGSGGGGVFALIPLIVLFPVIGLLINLAWGKHLGETWSGGIASGAAGAAFVIALLQFFGLQGNEFHAVTVPLADWIVIGELNIPWAFQIDTLSVTMMLVVTGIGTLIHIYAIGYMNGDVRHNGDPARFPRFFVYLNLFLAAMLILVTGNNYLMMFVGWEGVGLCSYLLIGFWFEKGKDQVGNARAARKAFVVNRIGDWAMLIAMFLIFWNFGSLTFDEVFAKVAGLSVETQFGLISAITLLLLIGATGKSAQVPLFVWLPDAMAGPTPVSALIHAATMVTAGIYMMTRSNALFALAPISQNAVAMIGAITALLAGTIAIGQFDIKKVLAYSTISQLGFMVAAVGLGGYVAGMFHLITHAFFKALLFLSSGSIIHAMEHGMHAMHTADHAVGGGGHDEHDEHAASGDSHGGAHTATGHDSHAGEHALDPQDMRNMGGLWQKVPVTKWVYLIGSLALMGIFPFAGFWSKDEILLDAFKHNQTVYWMLLAAAACTAFYMTRQVLMVFFGKARTDAARHAGESPWLMLIPLIALAALSVFGGALNIPSINIPSIVSVTPPGAHALTEWLGYTIGGGEHEAAPGAEVSAPAEGEGHGEAEIKEGELNLGVAGLSTGIALFAIFLAFVVYQHQPATAAENDPLYEMFGPLFGLLQDKWYVDEIYDALILRPYNWLSTFIADIVDWKFWHDWFHDTLLAGMFNTFTGILADGVDKGFVDATISHFPADLSGAIAGVFRKLQSGYVRSYALAIFVGVVGVLGYFLIAK